MKEMVKAILRGIVKGALYAYCKIIYRMKIIGRENIPKEGPIIVCGNHKSFLDPPLIMITAKRRLIFLAKAELTKSKFLAVLGWAFDVILVNKNSKDIGTIKASLKVLKNGGCIALFPEGTRKGLEKGEKVKDGAAFFAVRSGAKVVPVGISGGEKPFKRIYVNYGKPLDYSMYKGKKYADSEEEKEDLDKVTEDIMNNIIMLTNVKD